MVSEKILRNVLKGTFKLPLSVSLALSFDQWSPSCYSGICLEPSPFFLEISRKWSTSTKLTWNIAGFKTCCSCRRFGPPHKCDRRISEGRICNNNRQCILVILLTFFMSADFIRHWLYGLYDISIELGSTPFFLYILLSMVGLFMNANSSIAHCSTMASSQTVLVCI